MSSSCLTLSSIIGWWCTCVGSW